MKSVQNTAINNFSGGFPMNEKNTEKDTKSKRLTKISRYSAYIYLVFAICIVLALSIGIFSVAYDPKNISVPEVSIPEIRVPSHEESSRVPLEESKSQSEAPVQNDESGVDPTVNEPEPVLYYPVDGGSVSKDFTIDALVYSETMKDYRVHTGVDIDGELGSAVKSFMDGVVSEIREDSFMGWTVIIAHEGELVSVYSNLASEIPENIKVGATVKAGDVIGAIGTSAITEYSQKPHLHFELHSGGEYADPKPELSKAP